VKENTKLQEQLAERGEKLQRLSRALSAANADVSKSIASVTRYDELEAELNACKSDRDSAHKCLKEKEEEETTLSQKLAILEEALKDTRQAHKTDIEQRDKQVDSLKEQLESETKNANDAIKASDCLGSELKAVNQNFLTFKKEFADVKEQREKLKKDCEALASAKSQLDIKATQFKALIMDNDKALKEQKAQIISLTSDKHALQTQSTIANSENKQLKAKAETLSASVSEKANTVEALRSTVKQMKKEKDNEILKAEKLMRDIAEVSDKRDKALSEVSCLNHWLTETRKNTAEKQEESRQQIACLEASLKENSQKKDALEAALQTANTDLETTRSEVSNLNNSIQQLQQQLNEAKEKLSAVDGSENTVLPDIGKIEMYSDSYF
jgi:chromosome segregation ATPase